MAQRIEATCECGWRGEAPPSDHPCPRCGRYFSWRRAARPTDRSESDE